MLSKILRMLIYGFSGLLLVSALLILANYAGRFASSRSDIAPREEAGGELPGNGTPARQALAEAGEAGPRGSMIPPPMSSSGNGLPSSAVASEGAIMVVREKNFNGVAEPPKNIPKDVLPSLAVAAGLALRKFKDWDE